LGEKCLELLKAIAPQVERVGILMHPEEPINLQFFKSAESAAPTLKVKPVALAVHDADEIKRALTAFADIVSPSGQKRSLLATPDLKEK